MSTFSMEAAFFAVKLLWSEMNKKGFRLVFPLLSKFPFLFSHLCSSTFRSRSLLRRLSVTSLQRSALLPNLVSIFSPLIYLPYSLVFLSSSPLSFLHMLCLCSFTLLEERKDEERASLNYTCNGSSAPIQLGPTRCLPSRFAAFVSVAFLYLHLLCLCLSCCLDSP